MRSTPRPARKKATAPATPAPLSSVGVTLTHADIATLDRLAKEQSDEIGRTINRSTVLRAIIRLAETTMRPLALRNAIEDELQEGRKWGHDNVKPPV